MKYEAIIFDWDGTIGMTLHLWLAGYRQSLIDQGHTILDSTIAHDFFYEHDKGVLKYPEVDFENLIIQTRAHVHEHLDNLELYAGVHETVKELQESGVKMALVSSSTRQLVEKGLKKYDLEKYFGSIICGDDVTKHKPDPEAFNETIAALKLDPARTLIVGDAKTDILAGQAADTMTCLFTPEENELFYDFAESLKIGPDFNIITIPELLNI